MDSGLRVYRVFFDTPAKPGIESAIESVLLGLAGMDELVVSMAYRVARFKCDEGAIYQLDAALARIGVRVVSIQELRLKRALNRVGV
jgi:hypothetical protein